MGLRGIGFYLSSQHCNPDRHGEVGVDIDLRAKNGCYTRDTDHFIWRHSQYGGVVTGVSSYGDDPNRIIACFYGVRPYPYCYLNFAFSTFTYQLPYIMALFETVANLFIPIPRMTKLLRYDSVLWLVDLRCGGCSHV